MAFQFICPQGHLLQGEESLCGQQCRCPECGELMIVPQPPARDMPLPNFQPPGVGDMPLADFQPPRPDAAEPPPELHFGPAGERPSAAAPEAAELPGQGERKLHIPCPAGHELETPEEMIGQEALCPICGVQFLLRHRDSREYRQQRIEEEERRQQRLSRLWLHWSIAVAVAVVVTLLILILVATSN